MDWPHSDSGLATLAHLRIGQAFDALGKRAQAVKEYNWVLKNPGPDVYDSRVLAKKYKEKAYVPNRR